MEQQETAPSARASSQPNLAGIVAIGASAGGLAALKTLLAHVQPDTGLAYVIVMHLSPEHESRLAEILQPHTPMTIEQVTHTVPLEPDHVYVIPPNANLDSIDTHLRVTALEQRRQDRAPIDHFFRTLADTHDGAAIGVILTGTGSDGTLGLRRIKERGGLTIVQDPAEAEHDAMPLSAVRATPVDLVLPLTEIPPAVLRYVRTELPRPRATPSQLETRPVHPPLAYDRLHQTMLEQLGPPSVLVAPNDSIVHSSTRAGRFLYHPAGAVTSNVFKVVRDELRFALRAALAEARQDDRVVRTERIKAVIDGEPVQVALDVRPAIEPELDGFLLLTFVESPVGALRARQDQLATELAAMKRLHELVNRLLGCTDLATALDEVLAALTEITRATMGNVQLLDPETKRLYLVAQRGFDREFLERFAIVTTADDTACGRALRSGRHEVIEDVTTDSSYAPYRDAAVAAGYRACQSIPLTSRTGQLLGVLSTHYPEPYRPSERDVELLELYARQAADFLDHWHDDSALRASEARLGEENRHKDEYLAMLGHELRNPLAAIRHATELIGQLHELEPQLRLAHGVLDRQSAHISRIIDGLLEVSRIARGKVVLQTSPVELRRLVETVLNDKADAIEARGLELHRTIHPDPTWIDGDDVRLTQILDNLLSNAIKFTDPPGSITVTVSQEGDQAVVLIGDSGRGIAPETLRQIFEAFRQAPQDQARSTGGLGLGLALAKGLVELHRGTLVARSPGLGGGSEFEVRLPLRPPPREIDDGADESPQRPRRILIIDDNEDFGEMLSSLLTSSGHDVALARNGPAALASLHERPVDVVLCDLGLPGMSGHDVARAIRADAEIGDVEMISVSGYGQPEDHTRALDAGFSAHLVKPVDIHRLYRLISGSANASPPSGART